ncbi:unnamed protein product [Caenorhabditis brenneri]
MSKTTENPLSSLFNEPLFEEDVQQLHEPYFFYLLLGSGLFYACLMMAFIFLLNPYTKAFKKHSKLFGESPFLPIINHGSRVIKRVYMMCAFFMGGIVIFNIYPGRGIDLALVLIVFALRLEKWYRESNNLPMTFETVEPSTIRLGYQKFQTIYTACLIVVMLTQFWLGRKPTSSLPENIVITQTKYIGLVKLVVFIFYGISLVTGFQTILAYATFLSIDWILVPLVIEITEIKIGTSVVKAERMESQQPDV